MHAPAHSMRSDIIIVGASLAGLMTALALSRHGLSIVLLERSNDTDRTGAALQVGHGLLEELTGRRGSGRLATGVQTWQAVHAGLREAVAQVPDITVLQDARVEHLGQDERGAWAITKDQQRYDAAVVIGADGYQSVVRRSVSPERPDAVFADYLAWVGFADEAAVAARFPADLAFLEAGDYCMLGFPLPARDGSTKPGNRRIGWAWYDAGHNAILRETGAIEGSLVRHSLRPGDMPDSLFDELARLVRQHWPSPWREAMLDCIARRAVLGTPVVEYVPNRLVKGRLCLVGDAAHVATPMTGNGFSAAATDATSLAAFLDADALGSGPEEALRRYESARLPEVRALVQAGQRFSRGFCEAS